MTATSLDIPRHVPVLIEYRKGDRRACSLGFVIADQDGRIVVAGTMDGRVPMGIATIDRTSIVRVARLAEGLPEDAGRGGS